MQPIHVRPALVEDAPAICETVRRSITELCVADHKGDELTLAAWLANKTPANAAEWVASSDNVAIVAVRDATVVGFGLINKDGTLPLLYVLPDERFRGISKGLLSALESAAVRLGLDDVRLRSTETAREFYQRAGYLSAGDPGAGFGAMTTYPMVKHLWRRISD